MSLVDEVQSGAGQTVTLCFTDIEDSTPVLERLPDAYPELIATHHRLLREAFAAFGGTELGTEGDSFFVSFRSAELGILAAVKAQQALAEYQWPSGGSLRVRIGLHTGAPVMTSEGYVGLDVHRAARVKAAAHGGQILVSAATHDQSQGKLPAGIEFAALGTHRFKGLAEAEQLFQVLAPGLPRHFPPPNTISERPGNLPIQPTSLLGRERELADLQRLLGRHDLRLITLTGPGGAGKTRLAIEAAGLVALHFRGGAIFVELAAVRSAAEVPPAIARALQLNEGGAGLSPLVEHLRERQVLLLLDNFEQVLPAAREIAELLSACPHIKVVVTSRAPLRVRGEYEFAVPPLALPGPEDREPNEIAQSAAVQLFAERAVAARPGFTLSATNASAIAQICSRLDGLPLAIELVAARSKLLAPQALLERLSDALDFASQGPRDLPERHQSLRAAIAWSYELLPEEERQIFRHLTVFAGGFTLQAAEAIVPETLRGPGLLDRVEALVAKSLIRAVDSDSAFESRLTMLETIREFGVERLEEMNEANEARNRHVEFFRRFAISSERESARPEHTARLEQEADNLRAALRWSLSSAETARAGLSLAVAAGEFWWQRAVNEGQDWLRLALALTEGSDPGLRSRGFYWRAFLTIYTDPPSRAVPLAQASVVAARAPGVNPSLLALGLNVLAKALSAAGEHDAARSAAAEGLDIARQIGDRRLVGMGLSNVGQAAIAAGYLDDGAPAIEEAVATFRCVGDHSLLASPLCWLGDFECRRGNYAEAERALAESVMLLRESGDVPRMSRVFAQLAYVRIAEARHNEAAALLRESLAAAANVDFNGQAAWGLTGVAALLASTRPDVATTLLAAADHLACGDEITGLSDPRTSGARAVAEEAIGPAAAARAIEAGVRLSRSAAIALAAEALEGEL